MAKLRDMLGIELADAAFLPAAMVALLASPLGAASNGAAVRVEGGTFRSIL